MIPTHALRRVRDALDDHDFSFHACTVDRWALKTLYEFSVESDLKSRIDALRDERQWLPIDTLRQYLKDAEEGMFMYAEPKGDGSGYRVGTGYLAVNGTLRTEIGMHEVHPTLWAPLPRVPR